jgi:hypothetical protein
VFAPVPCSWTSPAGAAAASHVGHTPQRVHSLTEGHGRLIWRCARVRVPLAGIQARFPDQLFATLKFIVRPVAACIKRGINSCFAQGRVDVIACSLRRFDDAREPSVTRRKALARVRYGRSSHALRRSGCATSLSIPTSNAASIPFVANRVPLQRRVRLRHKTVE